MNNKNTNINSNFSFNYKYYYEFVDKLMLLNNINDFLLIFVDYILNDITFIESSLYLYDSNDKLINVINSKQGGIISQKIMQLIEGGILDFVRNTRNVSLIPNLSNEATTKININYLIIPLEIDFKIIGYSITITEVNLKDVENKFEQIKAFSKIFSYFLNNYLKSSKFNCLNQTNLNEVLALIVNNMHNSNLIINTNLHLLHKEIGDTIIRENIVKKYINYFQNLNLLYEKYQKFPEPHFYIKDVFADILKIDEQFINDNNISINIQFPDKNFSLNGSFYTFALIILKIINVNKNKEVNKNVINIIINKHKFSSEISINIDDNSLYFDNLDSINNSFTNDHSIILEIKSLLKEFNANIEIKSNFKNGTSYKLTFPIIL